MHSKSICIRRIRRNIPISQFLIFSLCFAYIDGRASTAKWRFSTGTVTKSSFTYTPKIEPPKVYEQYFDLSTRPRAITPCTYPVPSDEDFEKKCGISEHAYSQHSICNYDGAISTTEMDKIVIQLNKLFGKRGRCYCDAPQITTQTPPTTAAWITSSGLSTESSTWASTLSNLFSRRTTSKRNETKFRQHENPRHIRSVTPGPGNQLCWYKLAFAFLDRLDLPVRQLPNEFKSQDLCNTTLTSDHTTETSMKFKYEKSSAKAYGDKFAQILRERWRLGQCEEDILILVVVRRPDELGEPEKNETGPIVFANWGQTVTDHTKHVIMDGLFNPLTYFETRFNSLIKDKDRTHLTHYLNALLQEYVTKLTVADQTNNGPIKIKNFHYIDAVTWRNKQHIPDWALGAFGGCALLLIIMALGYCLVKSRVRRGASRSKPGADGGRRWKAGFVGGMLQKHRNSHASMLDMNSQTNLGSTRSLGASTSRFLDPQYGGHVNVIQKVAMNRP